MSRLHKRGKEGEGKGSPPPLATISEITSSTSEVHKSLPDIKTHQFLIIGHQKMLFQAILVHVQIAF